MTRLLVRVHASSLRTDASTSFLESAAAARVKAATRDTNESGDDAAALESVRVVVFSQHGQVSGQALHSDTVHRGSVGEGGADALAQTLGFLLRFLHFCKATAPPRM